MIPKHNSALKWLGTESVHKYPSALFGSSVGRLVFVLMKPSVATRDHSK